MTSFNKSQRVTPSRVGGTIGEVVNLVNDGRLGPTEGDIIGTSLGDLGLACIAQVIHLKSLSLE